MRKFNLMSKKRLDVGPYEVINKALKEQGHPNISFPANQSMAGALMSNPRLKLKQK